MSLGTWRKDLENTYIGKGFRNVHLV